MHMLGDPDVVVALAAREDDVCEAIDLRPGLYSTEVRGGLRGVKSSPEGHPVSSGQAGQNIDGHMATVAAALSSGVEPDPAELRARLQAGWAELRANPAG
jgi:hypothetical protein